MGTAEERDEDSEDVFRRCPATKKAFPTILRLKTPETTAEEEAAQDTVSTVSPIARWVSCADFGDGEDAGRNKDGKEPEENERGDVFDSGFFEELIFRILRSQKVTSRFFCIGGAHTIHGKTSENAERAECEKNTANGSGFRSIFRGCSTIRYSAEKCDS